MRSNLDPVEVPTQALTVLSYGGTLMAKKHFLAALTVFLMFWSPAQAYTPSCDPPPFVSAGANPMVMMVMERDHKLYYEAYNDAQDLDGDGKLDVGYKHSIDYYGYFDAYKCYEYDKTGQDRFVPTRYTEDKYCGGPDEWSGNFLNWLSMSRMDVLRRVLYGGHRSRDDSNETVLEGAYIPQDAHSWGKEYAGSDTRDLTPFDAPSDGKRHLFCVTSTEKGEPHIIRVAKNDTHRIWDWASTERAVCSGPKTTCSPETPSKYRRGPVGTRSDIEDYIVRVQVCSKDWDKGQERNYCKLYPGGGTTPKPVGLLQKYGEGDGSKMCSKSYKPCQADKDCKSNEGLCVFRSPLYMGLLTGSYRKNLSGGVLRKNVWTVMDEINPETGIFQSSENVQGNIILTLDRMRPVGFQYHVSDKDPDLNFSYKAEDGNGGYCGWITDRALEEGECRMWGNPVGEMMYEALRFLAGKGEPTSAFDYEEQNDAGLNLSKPDWYIKKGNDKFYPFDLFPECSKPNLLVLSDINPSYDSDQLPGTRFGSFSDNKTLEDLDVGKLADTIGEHEKIKSGTFFIGDNGTTTNFICSAKSLANLSSARGLCPEEPTKQGSFYSAAVAYYGKEFITAKEGIPEVNTYVVAMSSPIPDIRVKVGNGFVHLVPAGKSVSGDYDVKTACADKCELKTDGDRGLTIDSCHADAYCPSNQIVDFYVDNINYDNESNVTYAKFRVNFEDVEQGADHDMDAIVLYEVEPIGSNKVKVTLTSEYAAGSIDQVLGFVISGTTADGLYLPVKDKDVPDSADNDTPDVVANMPLTWSKTFTVSGSPAQTLKNPLWYAAKWGGFDDINGNQIPDLDIEWDKDGDGTPDNYFFVANPLELEKKLEKAMLDILTKAGSAGAVATVTQEVLGQDLVLRGAFTAYEDNPNLYAWKGHLEAYWPYEGCQDFTDNATCNQYSGCEWYLGNCRGTLYSFQKSQNKGKFCSDSGFLDGHCWDAGKEMTLDTNPRRIFTMIKGTMTELDSEHLDNDTANALDNTIDFNNDNKTTIDDAKELVRWLRGEWKESWTNVARDRKGWCLGDIVYSTPVVVGPPSISSVDPHIAGDCSCSCNDDNCTKRCFYCFRQKHATRKKVAYVGANDGMVHAFVVGVWDNETSTWVYDPDDAKGAEIGKELWAYVPSNLLAEVKNLAKPDYGHPSSCAHRTMVDLSPIAWDVYIDHDNDTSREWRTVLLGGERGGGDVYFALDVTDPDDPKVLWEYSVLRNLVVDASTGDMPFLDNATYAQVAAMPVSWTVPYVGYLEIPNGVCFSAKPRVEPLQSGTPNHASSCLGSEELSGWYAFVGATPHIFKPEEDFPASLDDNETMTLMRPQLVAIDIEKGVNIFQELWPKILEKWPSEWPEVTLKPGSNTIPYALGDPVALDLWNDQGQVAKDGKVDYLAFGDLNGNFYTLKFNLYATNPGVQMTVRKTKTAPTGVNSYRSGRQPVTVMPVATLDPYKNLWLYFGTGKFDNVVGGLDDRTDTAPMAFYAIRDNATQPTTFEGGFSYGGLNVSAQFLCSSSNFNDNCTWVKSDGTADCCESLCLGACWTCIEDLKIPGERVVDSALVAGGVVFFTTFVPKDDPCAAGGDAYLYAVDYMCRPMNFDPFANSGFTRDDNKTPDQLQDGEYTPLVVEGKGEAYVLKLGEGMPSRPVMDSSGQYLFIQTSNGEIHRLRVNIPPPVEKSGWKQRQ
ncbi:pilus assembly protein [Desulfosoma caldarium]|uniref:Type IV pilus assembly protein PilY1 n=1 Tax=Desulfosoma caldarium TaxID=610254 RepID=A0A3N1VGD7_9BACT|nr:PilC/PilY family type IV pilus protein [Desulfosoma caldarium]ROR01935.1 type IV pilus assembly protein PilY1 [Desulfosoma caldarium]